VIEVALEKVESSVKEEEEEGKRKGEGEMKGDQTGINGMGKRGSAFLWIDLRTQCFILKEALSVPIAALTIA
jgi:hypothetical protein